MHNRRRLVGLRWSVYLAAVVVTFLPAAFLIFYQQKFGFHYLIIPFGQAIVVAAMTSIGLFALGITYLLYPIGGRTSRIFLGIASSLLFVALVLIYAGAYVSNSLWGDTLNYNLALTFILHGRAVLDVLPVAPQQKTELLVGLVAASCAVTVITVLTLFKLSSSLSRGVDRWTAVPTIGTKRLARLACILAGTGAVAAKSLRSHYRRRCTVTSRRANHRIF